MSHLAVLQLEEIGRIFVAITQWLWVVNQQVSFRTDTFLHLSSLAMHQHPAQVTDCINELTMVYDYWNFNKQVSDSMEDLFALRFGSNLHFSIPWIAPSGTSIKDKSQNLTTTDLNNYSKESAMLPKITLVVHT